MGPVAAKSYPGKLAIDVNARPAQRAKQEIDYGRRAKGYVYGALWETTGDCWTQCYPRRSIEHFIDFLSFVDEQIPADKERIYAILDNLDMHHCRDLLLFMIHHERWEWVYQPTYAAYLNLIGSSHRLLECAQASFCLGSSSSASVASPLPEVFLPSQSNAYLANAPLRCWSLSLS